MADERLYKKLRLLAHASGSTLSAIVLRGLKDVDAQLKSALAKVAADVV